MISVSTNSRRERDPGAGQVFRDIRYASKVISLSLVGLFVAGSLVWIFGFGQPKYLYLAAVQVVNCGIMSEVEDPWTCDNGPDSVTEDINE